MKVGVLNGIRIYRTEPSENRKDKKNIIQKMKNVLDRRKNVLDIILRLYYALELNSFRLINTDNQHY